MAKPNYQFDKRQRDLAKKKQQDEKRLKKQQARDEAKKSTDVAATEPVADGTNTPAH
jgi:hypothetical protein